MTYAIFTRRHKGRARVMHAVTVLAGAFAARQAGWFEKRWDDRKIIISIAVTVVGAFLLLAFAPPHWALLAIYPISRIAWSLMNPLSTDMVNRMATSDVRATVLSVYGFGGRIIFIATSPFVAGLADHRGLPFAFMTAGLIGGALLLIVFISTNIAVLVLRRDSVKHSHFRAPTIFPIMALLTCVALLTQQSAATWLRAAALLAVGIVLYAVSRRTTKAS